MDWHSFASIFGLVFVAELPGKTTLANILLASHEEPAPVFLGACAAFAVHSAIAVAAGSLLGLLPIRTVQLAVGILFLILAVLVWRQKLDKDANLQAQAHAKFSKTAVAAFTLTFAAQWGDPSQLATAALAAKYLAPRTTFVSATLALWAVAGLAVLMGHFTRKSIHPQAIQKIASIIFAGVGTALLLRSFLK